MPQELDSAKYVSFTSYKKDGTPVSLPVWVVPFDGGYAFTTGLTTHKVARIKRDARASLAVSNFKGVVSPGSTVHTGAAVLLNGDDAARVQKLIAKKYRVGMLMLAIREKVQKLRGKPEDIATAAIKVTLNP
ncbi:MAG: hypothetical protein RLZZ544_9 [Actinomycetota bacterium]